MNYAVFLNSKIIRGAILCVLVSILVSCDHLLREGKEMVLTRYLKESRMDILEYRGVDAHSIVEDAHRKGNEALSNAGCECGFSVIIQETLKKSGGVEELKSPETRYSFSVRNRSVYDALFYIGEMIHADVSYNARKGTFFFKCREDGGLDE